MQVQEIKPTKRTFLFSQKKNKKINKQTIIQREETRIHTKIFLDLPKEIKKRKNNSNNIMFKKQMTKSNFQMQIWICMRISNSKFKYQLQGGKFVIWVRTGASGEIWIFIGEESEKADIWDRRGKVIREKSKKIRRRAISWRKE